MSSNLFSIQKLFTNDEFSLNFSAFIRNKTNKIFIIKYFYCSEMFWVRDSAAIKIIKQKIFNLDTTDKNFHLWVTVLLIRLDKEISQPKLVQIAVGTLQNFFGRFLISSQKPAALCMSILTKISARPHNRVVVVISLQHC